MIFNGVLPKIRTFAGISLIACGLISQAFGDITKARMLITKSDVQTFFGTTNVKLVFTESEKLYFVDFSDSVPAIARMGTESGIAVPVISPDGQYITYITGNKGDVAQTDNPSTAWLRAFNATSEPILITEDSAYTPRFDYGASELTVVYSTCSKPETAGQAWDGCGRVVRKAFDGTAFGAEQEIWGGGSYWGGISRDGRYLAAAEAIPGAYMLDLNNSAAGPNMVHKATYTDTATGVDSVFTLGQCCNPSMTSSYKYTNFMMYLDFGKTIPKKFENDVLGNAWGLHHRIFISTYDEIRKFYPLPGFKAKHLENPPVPGIDIAAVSIERPEWSNHPYYAVAALQVDRMQPKDAANMWTQSSNLENIFFINLKSGEYLNAFDVIDTVDGHTTKLDFPWLWVEVPAGFDTLEESGTIFSAPIGKSPRGSIYLQGNTIVSGSALESVDIYRLDGSRVGSIDLRSRHIMRFVLESKYFPSRATYLIKARAAGSRPSAMRLSVIR